MNVDSYNAVNIQPPLEEVKLIEAENEQNRHAYSVALVTAMAAEAAVAAANAAAEIVRLRAVARSADKTMEDVAAVKIQSAFRGYLARRVLKAMRGLLRLRKVIGGKSVKRQATSTLKCIQTMARVQLEIRGRRLRMMETSSAIQRQIQQKREKELEKPRVSVGENWDESTRSKEQIVASIQHREEAAMRRERALAYAYSHQQTLKNSSACADQTFMDPSNPRWGWCWLERWMAWENGNTDIREPNTDHFSKIQSPAASKRGCRQSPSTPKSKAKIRPMSPRDEDSKSMNSTLSDQCRRRSIGGSSVRDDEGFASSSAIPSYMASTESARAKSRLPTAQGSEYFGTPERPSSVSCKKRLSFSGSPARPRRHSGPAKTDAVS
ncbi:hypothetical protein ACS0TY_009337 [Phlomoides rotata]